MSLPPVVLGLALLQASADPPGVYSGRAGQLKVVVPRLEAAIAVDGALDEPVWGVAARLTGFSEYAPVDGRPAEDSTEVLVWYSSTAIYFGIRAFEPHGAVHATLADRDKIAADDYVQILLDTFDDHRQALVFGVNPLGVQADGVLNEGTLSGASGFGKTVRDTVDLSPDFVFQSKGRVTAFGYEVEIRIPFKSLRYQPAPAQDWGINVIRHVQHSGHQDTWTPARRAAPSFLGQSGTLVGLTELQRGLVLDVNPEVTGKVDGASASTGAWRYLGSGPSFGGNVRWGVTNNLTLTGTANPDFSQVEADASQLVFDPRSALFFPEKRPFFLEGIEQFDTPNTLVYARRLVQPVAALKLTGKVSGTNVGALAAVDDQSASVTGLDHPVFTILRVRRDVVGQSTVGVVYTDRIEGQDDNRVAGADARLVFGPTYVLGLQAAESYTRSSGVVRSGPLWRAALDRTGRSVGLHYGITGIHQDFVTQSGFISRAGIVTAVLDHQLTVYGQPGSALESWTPDVFLYGRWRYDDFTTGRAAQDRELHVNATGVLRGGWTIATGVFTESFGYDSALYANYALLHTVAGKTDTVPFVGTPHIHNLDLALTVTTPQFKHFSGTALILPAIQDENFFEWAPARILIVQASADWRPTEQLRVSASYNHAEYWRKTDGSIVGLRRIPRLKVEYQVSRPVFVRLVGQYDSQWQDSLRDDSRTNDPIAIRDPETGQFRRALAQATNAVRVDWLVSYHPTPGTVIYAGYGNSLTEPDALAFRALRRTSDGFFVKLSYLFRV
ncbi:MAG TPA: DUF5916 domain-containing protein [Gemmatimonadales bacterium]|nr:DUF5916 domain-containing protein [Gemmatimonadales bacterium]